MRKLGILIFIALLALISAHQAVAKDKVFAALNLKIVNKTERPITASSASDRIKEHVYYYRNSNWDSEQTDDIEIKPGESVDIHIGVYCKINRCFWIRTSECISEDAGFYLLIWDEQAKGGKDNIIKIFFKGGEQDYDPREQYTIFYFYHYTGSFVIDKVQNNMEKEVPDAFALIGTPNYDSKKYRNDVILTCDVPWKPEAGYYLIEVVAPGTLLSGNQILLSDPDCKTVKLE